MIVTSSSFQDGVFIFLEIILFCIFRTGVCLFLSLSSLSCGSSGWSLVHCWLGYFVLVGTVVLPLLTLCWWTKTVFNSEISRECGAPYLFLNALLHPSIRWRSHHFRLHWGGKAEAVVEKVDSKKKEGNFLEVPVIKLVSKSGKMGELTSSRSIS